ncbi:MAG: hypothetical protein WDW38_002462 [Sanguina aurantia]
MAQREFVLLLGLQSDTPPTAAPEACAPQHGHLHAFVEPLLDVYEGVSVLTLNRPSARNAIGKQMLQEVRECIANLRQEPSTRCVLVRSLASGVFCAGADLKERRAMSVLETAEFVGCLRNTFTALRELPMPTIAVLEGLALGGGAELTLACDLRVGGRDAVLGFPETQLGIIPGAGGVHRHGGMAVLLRGSSLSDSDSDSACIAGLELHQPIGSPQACAWPSLPRLIGVSRAKDLIFTGRRVHAEEALTIGLLDFVVDPGKAYARALQLAGEVCRGGPLALRAAKSALNGGLDVDLHTGLRLEESCYAQLLHSKDRAEGLAAFEAKRPPRFTGS